MTGQQREQLGLERGARAPRGEIGEERVVGVVEYHFSVEMGTQPRREHRLSDPDRAFDRNVAELQRGASIPVRAGGPPSLLGVGGGWPPRPVRVA